MAIKLKVQENNVSFRINDNNSATFKAEQGIPIYPNAYQGNYTVTPSTEVQTLPTQGLMMTDDVEVEAVPSAGQIEAYAYANVDNEDNWSLREDGFLTFGFRTQRIGYINAERSGWVETRGEFGEITDSVLDIEVVGSYGLPSEGGRVITPTTEEQIAAEAGVFITGDIKVAPIPNNYGLITWNGSTLTVS